MDDIAPLARHGRPADAKRDARGRYANEPSRGYRVTSRGNNSTYVIRKLSRDQHWALTALLRRKEIAARAASARAGYGHAGQQQLAPAVKIDVRCLVG
jgi:hypothetical protein